ncbi:putative cobalt transporter CbtA [Lysobacter niastensis]|uniref:Cobalt transporter CbtA n=1 Tax=Lysobacter niastensis TaxID=380629 RepID=A0ABU1W8Z4_9GAMM|nr:hypothetical protein [Lysobacter niastensis]MDR7134048.1 putative cobalt transporter CbtA [Lysobacter niastensis]
MNRFVRLSALAATAGTGLSGLIGWCLVWFAPGSWATTAYIRPGELIAPLLTGIVPTSFLHSVVPEGGAAAFVLLILVGSFVFWALALSIGLGIVLLASRRPNNSFKPKPLRGSA